MKDPVALKSVCRTYSVDFLNLAPSALSGLLGRRPLPRWGLRPPGPLALGPGGRPNRQGLRGTPADGACMGAVGGWEEINIYIYIYIHIYI